MNKTEEATVEVIETVAKTGAVIVGAIAMFWVVSALVPFLLILIALAIWIF